LYQFIYSYIKNIYYTKEVTSACNVPLELEEKARTEWAIEKDYNRFRLKSILFYFVVKNLLMFC